MKKVWDYVRKTNLHMMLLSLVFALIIWCYVIAGTNPIREKDVGKVPLSLINAEELSAKGLVIADSMAEIPDEVTVKVEASVNSHRNISADAIRVTVNLAEVNSEGDVTLNINATSSMSGVSVKSISPARITLKIDELVEREIPVVAKLMGEVQEGYYISPPALSENTVKISGAKEQISQVVRATCEIPVDTITSNTRMSYALKLYDKDDNEIVLNQFAGKLPSVIADMKVLPTKLVPIDSEDVKNAVTNVKVGYEVTGVVIEPQVVEIAAKQEILDEIDSVRLQMLNADGADKSVILNAEIMPMDHVEYVSRSSVEVLVQISEIQSERIFKNQEIYLDNLGTGLKAGISGTKYAAVTLKGGKTAIDGITVQHIRVYADMSGITRPGQYTRIVEVEEIPGISKITTDPVEIIIIVTK